jgi:hypothetical protein
MTKLLLKLCPVLIAVAGILGLLGCDRPSHIHGGGVSGQSGSLWVSGGHQRVVEGEPGVVFGMVKAGEGNRRFAYFLVFKHDFPHSVYSGVASARSDGRHASVQQDLQLGSTKVGFSYEAELADDERSLVERLVANGREYNISNGRTFLIDFLMTDLKIQQVDVPLPTDVPDTTESPVEIAQFAKETLDQQVRVSESVKQFVKAE